MNKRILRPTTIVPDNLYVERAADRQLRTVIDDMGRPAYILVARQMGKTNLLLHMKRERVSDIVLYLDLSNRFDSAQSWFRNVIDSLVEAFHEEFASLAEVIQERRKNESLEPSVEYDRHLRLLLRTTKRRVVIVLDEIDSLVNTVYSDKILSQIRSMYFSRSNYSEYERLTYVLSGVAEPTDLIKDKNISPFNIGEKIYLDNFNTDEFRSFFDRSGLSGDATVVDSVFQWTSGNPRLSWDICAELEIQLELQGHINSQSVDEVVQRLYFREYDRAPIDHIRTLVESDSQIRDAIVAMRYGKSEFLENKIKSRLYLAGITTMAGGGDLQISNKIVDHALSDQWLEQIENNKKDPFVQARQSYYAGNFTTAIENFLTLRALLKDGKDIIPSDLFLLGMSYLQIGRPQEAQEHFIKCLSSIEDTRLSQEAQFYLAVSYRSEGRIKDAIELFEKVSKGPDDDLSQHSILEEISALIQLGEPKLLDRALESSKRLAIELEAKSDTADVMHKSRLVAALYSRATVYVAMKKLSLAAKDIEQAINICTGPVPPIVFLCQYDSATTDVVRLSALKQLIDNLISSNCKVHAAHNLSNSVTKLDLARVLLLLDQNSLIEDFQRLVKYYAEEHLRKPGASFLAILDIYSEFLDIDQLKPYYPVFIRALELFKETAKKEELLKAVRLVASGAPDRIAMKYIEPYLDLANEFYSTSTNVFPSEDISAFIDIATILNSNKNGKIGRKFWATWSRFKPKAEQGFAVWFLVLDQFEMQFWHENGAIRDSLVIANRIINETERECLEKNFPGADRAMAVTARRRAAHLLGKKVSITMPLREHESDRFKNIGRNDKIMVQYGNAEAIVKKFKLVEADLRKGICVLVDGGILENDW